MEVEPASPSIGFVARITATSSPVLNKYAKLTVPISFVRQHGEKMQESVKLRSRATGRTWTVRVVVYHPQRSPQVMFAGGWSAFASFNCLAEGDRVTFTLLSVSEFEVGISRGPGASAANEEPETRAAFARGHGHEYRQRAVAPRKKLPRPPPRFLKKLSRTDGSILEMPSAFARAYGIRLDKSVELRWMHRHSPPVEVACTWRLHRDRVTISLTNGWQEFTSGNALHAGQELEFTLVAESSFVVSPQPPKASALSST